MGEYAHYNGQQIKIGTCENMYYLRYDERHAVATIRGNVDPATDLGLRFRVPFPDEDNMRPGSYEPYNRGERLYKMERDHMGREYSVDFSMPAAADSPGTIQLSHESGLLFCVPCHHGERLPDVAGIRFHWNGKTHSYELTSIKRHDDGNLWPVVTCRHCGQAWRAEWSEVLPYTHGELKRRLECYAKNEDWKKPALHLVVQPAAEVVEPEPVQPVVKDDYSLSNDHCWLSYDAAGKQINGRDLRDRYNEPAFFSKSKRGIKSAWAALFDQFNETTTMHEAQRILIDNGIRCHSWCMVD